MKICAFGIPSVACGNHNLKDPRLDEADRMVEAKKKTYAQVEVIEEADLAGLSEFLTLGNQNEFPDIGIVKQCLEFVLEIFADIIDVDVDIIDIDGHITDFNISDTDIIDIDTDIIDIDAIDTDIIDTTSN